MSSAVVVFGVNGLNFIQIEANNIKYFSYLSLETIVDFNTMKTSYITLTPLKPHFYIVKQGFTGVYIIFLISAQKHRLLVLVRTASTRRF